MPLRFILGPPGAGKTSLCLNEIEGCLRDANHTAYFLIPEQFSLQAEKLLLSERRASLRAQALSFNRLAHRVFARLGVPAGKQLDEAGKNMLLRKVMFECGERLIFYKSTADRQGFIDKLARAVTEFNHHRITPEDLLLRVPGSDETLAAKLSDLALILQKYREAVTGRYLLTDDTLDLLCRRLEETPVFNGSFFWADGFFGFTPQEERVLGHLMTSAERLTVTLPMRRGSDDSLFAPVLKTLEQLTDLAKKSNVPVEKHTWLENDFRRVSSPGLYFFTKNFSAAKPVPVYEDDLNESLAVISAGDDYAAAYEAANRVWALVKRGYRFRDIAVLTGERGRLEKILQTVFDRDKIPIFTDTPSGVLAHPLTELIRAALDIVIWDWQYEGVMRFLKTRLTPVSVEDIDRLENHILARGIRGYRWRYPFTEGFEDLRLQALSTMSVFENIRAESKATVLDFCRLVTDMLYFLRVPDTLSDWYCARTEAGDTDTARLHRQVWPKICEVLDKLAEILGEETVTLRVFAKLLDAGLAQADLGRIPPTVDQVFLGDAGRSRYPAVKAMIVIGANEGRLPPPPVSDELLSDSERVSLRNAALRLAPDGDGQQDANWFSLYCALCRPSESLSLIYSVAEPGGRALKPSAIIRRICAMFPRLAEQKAVSNQEASVIPFTPAVYKLSSETTERLYGRAVITAASRLERYAACPFSFYVTYNLKAREREIYRVHPADLGVLYHEVLAAFSTRMAETDWGLVHDREEISKSVDTCVDELVSEPGNVLHSTARNRHILKKVKRICVTSIWALCEHIKRGDFVPAASEIEFAPHSPTPMPEIILDNGRKLLLTGRVDRVDVMRVGNGTDYLKIIDYKSGKKKFDLSEVKAGTQLQLILYMNALLKNAELFVNSKPGGVFYFHLDDPVLLSDAAIERREELLLECFKMSGLALSDAAAGFDSALEANGKSPVIPVTVNKDGSFSKSSSVADLEFFTLLGNAVQEKIKELGTRMTDGVITPEPYKNGKYDACNFCPNDVICSVDYSVCI